MYKSEVLRNPNYNKEELSTTWGQPTYDKYLTSESTWQWSNFPNFSQRKSIKDKCSLPQNMSVLEVGCAAGGAYKYLMSNGAITEKSDYTGLDISEKGIHNCKTLHPEANWIKADLTSYKFKRKFDFSFERIAVHHMPDPLAMFDKIAAATNISMATGFVSCLKGTTISNLELARYRHSNGELVFFDIINPLEVCEVMLDHGFRKFEFLYRGVHEKIDANPLAHQYLSPDISRTNRMIGRTQIIATKTGKSDIETNLLSSHPYKNNVILFGLRALKSILTNRWYHVKFLEEQLQTFQNRTDGVLIKSRYD